MATVADLLAALRGLPPGLEIGNTAESVRLLHHDGRRQHLTIEDGVLRVQAEAADPSPIPPGGFCYLPAGFEEMPDGLTAMLVRACPYFRSTGGQDAWCGFMDNGGWGGPLWDQVKCCGISPEDPEGRHERASAVWRSRLEGQPHPAGRDRTAPVRTGISSASTLGDGGESSKT
jgi:hypothetical protein